MSFFYQIAIQGLGWVAAIARFWNPKIKAWFDGRKDWQQKLRQSAPENGYDLWMHCSSLGEFEQGRPVLEGYRKRFPNHQILLTFYSPSGYEIRKNYAEANTVMYLPIDTRSNVSQFLALVNPKLSILVKYDFWPNLLIALKAQRRKAWLIAAKFHAGDQFHQWYGQWTRSHLLAFDKIFLQDKNKIDWYPADKQLFAGDPRIDRVQQIQSQNEIPAALTNWKQGPIFIWGSVWPQDWPLLTALITGPLAHWQHLIAPHEIGEPQVLALQAVLPQNAIRFTKSKEKSQIMILDTIGQLSSAYQIGDLAYIGGGLGKGIHNILEPLAAGLPTYFGPKHHKFPEADAAIEAHCGFVVGGAEQLSNLVSNMLADHHLPKTQELARDFIKSRAGATKMILEQL